MSTSFTEVTDPGSLRFWHEEYPSYTKMQRAEAAAPILNKAGQFTASPHLRLILGQIAPRLDLAFTMNSRRILIANLAKGTIGEQAANLLGSLLVSHMQLVAMERGALPPEQRVPFFVHVDEFQTFSSEAFASLLSEARKFATHFCLANQYTDQLSSAVRAAVLGNAGTLVVFRVGSRDAELLAPEFRPMDAGGLADQEPFTAWLRRGIGRDRICAEPKLYRSLGTADLIREQSRQRFGRARCTHRATTSSAFLRQNRFQLFAVTRNHRLRGDGTMSGVCPSKGKGSGQISTTSLVPEGNNWNVSKSSRDKWATFSTKTGSMTEPA